MFASHIILGVTLISFSAWLQWTETQGWPNESREKESDAEYLRRRMRSRRRVNIIFAICGLLILMASVAGPRLFLVAWMSVTFALMAVVVLAAADVLRTRRHQIEKLPEVRRRMLNGDD